MEFLFFDNFKMKSNTTTISNNLFAKLWSDGLGASMGLAKRPNINDNILLDLFFLGADFAHLMSTVNP